MTTPVFVIHGIGHRDRRAFGRTVAALGAAAGGLSMNPVFWGHLGAAPEWVTDAVPGAPAATETRAHAVPAELAAGEALGLHEEALGHFLFSSRGQVSTRNGANVPPPLLDAVSARLGVQSQGALELRSDPPSNIDAAVVQLAVAEAWVETRWLPLVDDPSLLEAVGAAIAGPVADGSGAADPLGTEVRGLDVAAFVRRRLGELDAVVGAAIGAAGRRLNTHLRTELLPGITRSIGDVLVYQRHRKAVQDCVRSEIAKVGPELGRSPEHPVDVVAHSLGGVVAVDMATTIDEPLWIRRLVTFGSQSPFFHVCDPRGEALAPYCGTPVQLPSSLGLWTNLWEPFDPVAFVAAKVFQLHDGRAPRDVEVPHLASSGLWTHSDYWTLQSVAAAITRALN